MPRANGGFRHYEGEDSETHTPEGEQATTQVHRFLAPNREDLSLPGFRSCDHLPLYSFTRCTVPVPTIAGLASARARGRKGGRPAKLTPKQVCTARKMLADPEMTIKEVAEAFGVNRATIYRSLGLGSYAKQTPGEAA
jgi:hypothetical protein